VGSAGYGTDRKPTATMGWRTCLAPADDWLQTRLTTAT